MAGTVEAPAGLPQIRNTARGPPVYYRGAKYTRPPDAHSVVWALVEGAQGNWQMTLVLAHNLTVSSFGRDSAGELYLVDYGNGAILRLRSAP